MLNEFMLNDFLDKRKDEDYDEEVEESLQDEVSKSFLCDIRHITFLRNNHS